MQRPGYSDFCEKNGCDSTIILNQVHGMQGYTVQQKKETQVQPYSIEGDYIVTTCLGVALAVETADCVPLVLVDESSLCSGVVHAGWRGSLGGVVESALDTMLALGASINTIKAYFGPAARGCCYQVGSDFVKNFENWQNGSYLRLNDGVWYFDNVSCITEKLQKFGIDRRNIITDYAACTVCCENYCSLRRQGTLNLRQITIVALK